VLTDCQFESDESGSDSDQSVGYSDNYII